MVIICLLVKLEKARQESRSKEESLRKLEENLQNLENRAKGKDQTYKNQQEKIKELEGQLVLKSNLHSQSEKQVLQLSDRLKGREELCSSLQIKVGFHWNHNPYFACSWLTAIFFSAKGQRTRKQA